MNTSLLLVRNQDILKIKWIDFGAVYRADGTRDDNLLMGIRSLRILLSESKDT